MPKGLEERAGLLFMALCLLSGLVAVGLGGSWLMLLPHVPVFWLCSYGFHECRKKRAEIQARQAYWDRKLAERLASR